MKRVIGFIVICLFLFGCTDENVSIDNSKENTNKLLNTIEELKEEIEHLQSIEEEYLIEKDAFPYISLNTEIFLIRLAKGDVDGLTDLLHSDGSVEEKDGEIYFVHDEDEIKITYNDEENQLERWFIESTELIDSDKIKLLTRTHYLDKNQQSVQEDRNFSITFIKEDENWLVLQVEIV